MDIHASSNFKGYTALLGENTNPENNGDLHEGFDIGWEPLSGFENDGRQVEGAGVMLGENMWPSQSVIDGFKEPVLEY